MDIDTEGMLIHAASSPVMALSGSSLADVFPSPHTRLLLEQLRREADLFRSRGEEPPGRVLNYEEMPVILNPGTVVRITGTMQITQARFGRTHVLMAFSPLRRRSESEGPRRSQNSQRSAVEKPDRALSL